MRPSSIVIVLLTILLSISCDSKTDTKEKKEINPDYSSPLEDSNFFTFLNMNYPGMEDVRTNFNKGDLEKAKAAYLDFRKTKSTSKWNVNPADKPTVAATSDFPPADNIMNHISPASEDAPEAFLGKEINWEFNPVDSKDPRFSNEWTYGTNRMYFWNTMGNAYWSTLDEKYTMEWIAQMTSWVKGYPVVVSDNRYGTKLTWRTIESGIRMAGSWMNAYYYFLSSPSFTPEANATFVKGVIEHGQRLEKITIAKPDRSGNWITMECNGLGTIGILFPELKEAENYRIVAFDRLDKELDKQVYPDGAEVELTTGYHQVSRSNFMELAKLAQMNNFPLPTKYMDKLKKMYEFNLNMMDPTGILPPFNDAEPTRTSSSLKEAYSIWKDEEFLFGATLGKEGKKPAYDSYYFNWAGYYVMRSGWNYNDNCLYFDAGPVGYGHEHEDMLNLYLYSRGRILLTEPGTYSYDLSKWRRFALSTYSHNTIIVDGKEQHRGDIPGSKLLREPLNNPWVTSPLFDYGRGIYSSGYQENKYKPVSYAPREYVGPKDTSISHTRHVIFLRPYYYLAVDFLEGKGKHLYESHFNLNAPDAKINDKTKAVRTMRQDTVQLELFPMDIENMNIKVVKGQMDPILGWITYNRQPIPTVVYTKNEEAPSTFSTFLYPYFDTEPVVNYHKIMADNKNLWAETISTPYETASVIISKVKANGIQEINTGTSPVFSATADVIVIRKPAGKSEEYLGFSGLKEYKTGKLAFTLSSSPLLVIAGKDITMIYCPQKEGTEIQFTLPLTKKIAVPGNQWVELTKDGINPVSGPDKLL
jgi:hypothetical protein